MVVGLFPLTDFDVPGFGFGLNGFLSAAGVSEKSAISEGRASQLRLYDGACLCYKLFGRCVSSAGLWCWE